MTKVWGPHGLVARATSMVSAPSIIPARTRGGARRRSFRAAVLVIASKAEADAADARSTAHAWKCSRILHAPRRCRVVSRLEVRAQDESSIEAPPKVEP